MTDVSYKRNKKPAKVTNQAQEVLSTTTGVKKVVKTQKLVHLKNQMKGLLVHEYENHYLVEFTKEHGQTYPSTRMSCYVPKHYVFKLV